MSTKKLWWLLPLACLAACSNGSNHEMYSAKNAAAATDSTTVMALDAPERKIIRMADFHCKVNNVFTAVDGLERNVKSMGGIVQESNLSNTEDVPQTAYYKADSLKSFHIYTTTATLTLRVPVASLDSVIHSIPAMVSFIDARTLKQTDVTAEYTGNKLREQTGTKVYTPEKAIKLAKKPEDLLAVQQYEDDNTSQLINKKVENMHLLDAVNYATLTVALSQAPQVFVQIIPNPDYIAQVPFTTQFGEAVSSGWNALQSIFIALLTIWPLLLLAPIIYVFFKKLNLKRRFARPSAMPTNS